MRKVNFPLSALTVAILSMGLAGCGDSDSSSTDSSSADNDTVQTETERDNKTDSILDNVAATNANTVPASQVTGKAVDGYLSGATVCLDLNRDFVCAPDEPATTTLNDGRYLLDLPSSLTAAQRNAAQVVVQGGIDQDTGSEFTGKMSAPLRGNQSGQTHVTPFSTLLAQVVSDNSALTDADKTKVAGWLEGVAAEDVTGDPKTENELLIEAVALQKTLDMLVAGSSKTEADTLKALKEALEGSQQASGTRTTAATEASKLEQAVDAMPDATIPAAVKNAAKSVAKAVRDTGSENKSGDLPAALAAVSKKAAEAVDTVKSADDKTKVNVTVAKATAEDINTAKIDRILGLAGYEADSEGETEDPVVTALKGFTALTGTTTLEELQTWVKGASFDGKAALLQTIDNALLMAKANPIVPVDMKVVADKGGFIEYDVEHGVWAYGFPTLGTFGISASSGQLAGEIPFDGPGLDPASGKFDAPFLGRDIADEWFYSEGSWYPMTSETFRIENGVMYVDAANTAKDASVTWREARLVAIEDLSGQTKPLSVWDSEKSYSLSFPEKSAKFVMDVTGPTEPALTVFPYDGSGVGTFTDQPYSVTPFNSWEDFEANCLGKSNCSLAAGGNHTYLTTGAKNDDGTYPLIEQGFEIADISGSTMGDASYQRTVGLLVPKITADGMSYWRMDVNYQLLQSGMLDDNNQEKPALMLHPYFDRSGVKQADSIISKGYVSSNADSDLFISYSRNTASSVAEYFSQNEFDKLDVNITYDASACRNLTDSMRLEVRLYDDEESWEIGSGFKGVSEFKAQGTAYSLKEIGSFKADPANMRIFLRDPSSSDGPLVSIYDSQWGSSKLSLTKVSDGHFSLTGEVTDLVSCFD